MVSPKHSKSTLSPLNFTPSSRSPASGSMPSSPTSIHSSSSAIFERDIQLPPSAMAVSSSFKDPHRTARAMNHDVLESAVPPVLTAAVAALGEVSESGVGLQGPHRATSFDEIQIEAPSPLNPLHWQSSSSPRRNPNNLSRSPSPQAEKSSSRLHSPSPSRISRPNAPQNLSSGNVPQLPGGFPSTSDLSPTDTIQKPLAQEPTSSVIDVVPPTPNAKHFNFSSGNASPSPPSTSSPLTPPPIALPQPRIRKPQGGSPSRPTSLVGTGPQLSLEELSLSPLIATTPDSPIPIPSSNPLATSRPTTASPPSPSPNNANKRLSFISYNDMLNSTPISQFTLKSVVTNPPADEEPPHLVATTTTTTSSAASMKASHSPTTDVFGLGLNPAATAPVMGGGGGASGHGHHTHSHDESSTGKAAEWEREGLGRGLEERLEAVLAIKGDETK
ncbi:hypothetical protein FRC02_007043 [Tulasnella sp. 418]|nr:hypothetical protein FRC02_007043 [Tulasnella sp. 418]